MNWFCVPLSVIVLKSISFPREVSRISINFTLHGATAYSGPGSPQYRGFMITLKDTHTLNTTPLDVGSARHRDIYLTTHNINKRQIFMPPAGFERTVSESEQTHALYHTATGTGYWYKCESWNLKYLMKAKGSFVLYLLIRLGSLRTIISGRMQESNLKCYRLLLWLLIL